MKPFDVGIIGAGVMGAAAAYELARRGASVVLVDQARLPNAHGASVDHSKIFRFAYPEPLYVEMAVAALALWRELEAATGVSLLTPAGLLLLGNDESDFAGQSFAALREFELDVETLTREELAVRYPQFHSDRIKLAVFDPSGAITQAEAAVEALLKAARRLGVTIQEGERIQQVEHLGTTKLLRSATGSTWPCAKVLVASGPWTRWLLPEFANRLAPTKQEVVYFKPVARQESFAIGAFPIFLDTKSSFYGFPIHHQGALKVGHHQKGEAANSDSAEEAVGDEFIARCRAFFADLIPALADAEVIETRICLYNNTPDDDFIIDWHPRYEQMLITTGFSGHGFKFGPLVGRLAADLLLDGKTPYDLTRFRLARFRQTKDEGVRR